MKTSGRIAEVNKELKRLGHAERLFRGRGYFYFRGGDATDWYTSAVHGVGDINKTTVDFWIREYYELSGKSPTPKEAGI